MSDHDLLVRVHELQAANHEALSAVRDGVRLVVGLAGVVIALVCVQLVAKFVIFFRAGAMLNRVETLLGMVEQHGSVTDSKSERIRRAVETVRTDAVGAAVDVKRAVDAVPEKVAERLQPSNGGSLSDPAMPRPKLPPEVTP